MEEISRVIYRPFISKIRVFGIYYKKSLVINMVFSLAGAGIGSTLGYYFFVSFSLSFMTSGYLLAVYLHELRHKRQYYLYYNKGISKLQLISYTFILNGLLLTVAAIIITRFR